jgi:HPt (histidine-containing phosphotransfer) domain-containing protein
MDGFIAKPVSLDALSQTLAPWLPGVAAGLSGPAPPVAEEAIFDPEFLRRIFGDDRPRLLHLVDEFAKAGARDIAVLLAAGDGAGMAGAAHRIKGAARAVGAERLAALAETIETAASRNDVARARREADTIEDRLAEALRAGRQAFRVRNRAPARRVAAGRSVGGGKG